MCGSREGREVRALLGANSPLTPKTEPRRAAVQPCGPFGVAGSQGPSGLCMDGGLCCRLRVAETRDSNDTHSATPTKTKLQPPRAWASSQECGNALDVKVAENPAVTGLCRDAFGVPLVTLFRWPVFCRAPFPGSPHPTSACLVRAVTCALRHVTARGRPCPGPGLVPSASPHHRDTLGSNLGGAGLRLLRAAGPAHASTPGPAERAACLPGESLPHCPAVSVGP